MKRDTDDLQWHETDEKELSDHGRGFIAMAKENLNVGDMSDVDRRAFKERFKMELVRPRPHWKFFGADLSRFLPLRL